MNNLAMYSLFQQDDIATLELYSNIILEMSVLEHLERRWLDMQMS